MSEKKRHHPPRIAEILLRTLLSESEKHDLLGDYEEFYQEISDSRGRFIASLWYWIQIIHRIPYFIQDAFTFGGAMLKNVWKLAARNITKNKLFSIISIVSISLAIGCFTVAFVFYDFENNRDAFHKNADEIFLVKNIIDRNGDRQVWGDSPMPLGPALQTDFPQIENRVRIHYGSGIFRYQDKVFNENFLFVDPGFFDMFTFPILMGDKNGLQDKNAIIISDNLAEKYFGMENPIGKSMVVSNNQGFRRSFLVKGVVKKNPDNSSIRFNILMPYENRIHFDIDDPNSWDKKTSATFVQVDNPTDIRTIESDMGKYLALNNTVNEDWPIQSFFFQNLLNISKTSRSTINDIGQGSHPAGIFALLLFGIFLVLLACFNYVNIGIVTATRRLKEIGIRKVLGSSKSNLIFQFLGENMLLCLIAILIGAVLAKVYLIPSFSKLFPVVLELNIFKNARLLVYFGIAFIITSIGTGLYPAFYVSRFHPISILRKTSKVGGGSKLTKVLLAFQFILTFIMIASAFILAQNATFQKNIDWGYNQEQVIVVPLDGATQYDQFNNSIRTNPYILNTAGARYHIGRSRRLFVVEHLGTSHETLGYHVGHDLLNALQIDMVKGRQFDRTLSSDLYQSIIVNETFVTDRALEKPIGEKLVVENETYNIVGVVRDFHHSNLFTPIEPIFFRLCDQADFKYIVVKASGGSVVRTQEFLRETWKSLFPDTPYTGFYQNAIWDDFYRECDNVTTMFTFIGLIAMILSCSGIFGLISLSIIKRIKEVSIRKILGATFLNIAHLLNRNLLFIMMIAPFFGIPLCYLLMNSMLGAVYVYRAPITLFPFIISGVLLIFTTLLTVSLQIIKAARANPIDTMKVE